MDKKELLKKITEKKEYSSLPKRDVEVALARFDTRDHGDEEKVKLTRNLLRKVFSSFTSEKLLNVRNRDAEWILKKHISTRERFEFYPKLYQKILSSFDKKRTLNIFDLGAGVNGFSYKFMEETRKNFFYVGVEAIGQLVELMNSHFKTRGIEHCMALHMSLFELEKLKKYVKQGKGQKVIFLFKTLDSLEMLERNYSKKLLLELVPLVDRTVISFATKSLGNRRNFHAQRKWLVDFIEENFKILDSFEFGGERYFVFKNE